MSDPDDTWTAPMPGELTAAIAIFDIADQLDAYAGWRLIGPIERTRHTDDIDRARTEWTRAWRCRRIARRLIKAGRIKP